jgi:glycosyltransferase involved in cell wall biosynthesis
MREELVSFIVLAYNQQQFVAEAISGALAQTYQPLEIVISDDCSTDGTFDVIKAEVNAYRGPHKIVAMQMPRNLGIGEHVNQAFSKCSGRLIVGGAGDDISLPKRVETVVKRWQEGGRKAKSIYSAYRECDKNGVLSDRVVRSIQPKTQRDLPARVRVWNAALGCTHCYDRESFEMFGPLNKDVMFEDAAINFRSWALGGILEIDEPLVIYRMHAGAVTSLSAKADPDTARNKYIRWQRARFTLFKQYLIDLDTIEHKHLDSLECIEQARAEVMSLLREAAFQYQFARAPSRSIRFRILCSYVWPRGFGFRIAKAMARAAWPSVDAVNIRALAK